MEEEIRKQYEIETGKKWFTVPFTRGEQAFASWGYQLWLEKKISQVEPEVKVNFADIKQEFEKDFRISKHHEEICKKALEQFELDMKSIKCETGEQGVLNPTMIQALTFYRYYNDIIEWLKSKISA